MPCLNFIVVSLRCAQCRKYAMHIIIIIMWHQFSCLVSGFQGLHSEAWHTHIYAQSENSVTIMCLALRRSAITKVRRSNFTTFVSALDSIIRKLGTFVPFY